MKPKLGLKKIVVSFGRLGESLTESFMMLCADLAPQAFRLFLI